MRRRNRDGLLELPLVRDSSEMEEYQGEEPEDAEPEEPDDWDYDRIADDYERHIYAPRF